VSRSGREQRAADAIDDEVVGRVPAELLMDTRGPGRERFALVAHSYGATIALIAAISQPRRIQALALYEPTLFGLLDAESPPPNEADGIRGAVASAAAAVEAGDLAGAAEYFVDFWMGSGAWARTPEPRKGPIAQSIVNVRGWADALFNEPTPLAALSQLKVPVLYMMGSKSPSSSRGVGRLLIRALPKVQVVEFNGMGHMGPVTHPEVVNDAISRFLEPASDRDARLCPPLLVTGT
jgi:pimeloyl-ACP methyl ester carboxylesterase